MKLFNSLLLLVLILLFFTPYVNGQTSKKYLKYKRNFNYEEGFVINHSGDTLKGLIKHRSLRESIVFVSQDGKKKNTKPNMILGYHRGRYKYISSDGSFYKLESEGQRVDLFKRRVVRNAMNIYHNIPGGTGLWFPGETEKDFFFVKKKKESNFVIIRKRKFVDKFSKYFSDCQEAKKLVETVEKDEWGIRGVLRAYNWCEKTHNACKVN